MPALTERFWIPEDIRALPDDGQRHECIDGLHLVTPSPRLRHEVAATELAARLRDFVRLHHVGTLLRSPADLQLTANALVQPDLFVVRRVAGTPIENWADVRHLALAVEILSPRTARYDRGLKREYYQRAGVEEYWVVDLQARLVERWEPTDDRPEVLRAELTWLPSNASSALVIGLPDYFDEVEAEIG